MQQEKHDCVPTKAPQLMVLPALLRRNTVDPAIVLPNTMNQRSNLAMRCHGSIRRRKTSILLSKRTLDNRNTLQV